MRIQPLRLTCPSCRRRVYSSHEVPAHRAPRRGDYWVCPACGEPSIFSGPGELRRPGPADLVVMMLSDQWPTMEQDRRRVRAWAEARGRAGGAGGCDPPAPG